MRLRQLDVIICCGCLQLIYSLITSLLIILLTHPEVLDRFQCTDDVAPTKLTVYYNATAAAEKHHVKVLSLKNLDKGLSAFYLCHCIAM